MGASEAEIVLELAKARGALTFGEFRLSAGGTSSYYFDGRIITLDPEAGYHIARAILPILRQCRAQAIAGPTLGGGPLSCHRYRWSSHLEGHPVPGLIVRKETKGHGGQRMIEGPMADLGENARVAVVDDACTSGSNLMHAIAAVEAAGHQVVKVITVLDRNEGGSDEIRRRGYDFVALLEANDQGEIRAVNVNLADVACGLGRPSSISRQAVLSGEPHYKEGFVATFLRKDRRSGESRNPGTPRNVSTGVATNPAVRERCGGGQGYPGMMEPCITRKPSPEWTQNVKHGLVQDALQDQPDSEHQDHHHQKAAIATAP